MASPLHSELKKEFQLERLILFSDAVFAIAITLLVIEIKIPEIPKEIVNDHLLVDSLVEQIPKFVGFFISFMIIGLYWTIHHRMFGFVINYTRKMLWLNLFFLMGVALMPFSTGFYSVYIIRLLQTPVIVYVSNLTFLGLMNFLLWLHISNPKLNLTEGLRKEERQYFSFRALSVPLIFIITAVIYIFNPKAAAFFPPLVPIVMRLSKRFFFKKRQTKSYADQ